jgi:PAS domain S-box-containing protein
MMHFPDNEREFLDRSKQSDLPIVVTEKAPPYNVKYVNDAWQDLCGYTSDEVCGRSLTILQGALTDSMKLYNLRACIVLNPRDQQECQVTNYRKNGEHFINHVTIKPLKNESNEVVSYAGVLREVKATQVEDVDDTYRLMPSHSFSKTMALGSDNRLSVKEKRKKAISNLYEHTTTGTVRTGSCSNMHQPEAAVRPPSHSYGDYLQSNKSSCSSKKARIEAISQFQAFVAQAPAIPTLEGKPLSSPSPRAAAVLNPITLPDYSYGKCVSSLSSKEKRRQAITRFYQETSSKMIG